MMRIQRWIILMVFSIMSFWATAQNDITIKFDDEALVDVFKEIEKTYGLSFSYNNELIENIKVSGDFKNTDVNKFLTILLERELLKFEFVEEKYVLISPDLNKEIKKEEINITPELSLCGQIIDELTKDPLSFTNVYILKSTIGAGTDDNGEFKFQGNFTKKDSLVISFMGYESQQFLVADLLEKSSDCPVFILKLESYESVAVKVTGYLMDGVYLGEDANQVKIQPDKMSLLPGHTEPDIMSAVQMLPGIISPDESASKIHVRGGTPDQNLILWDGIPIYHSGHFFGSISAFNPYIVDEVNVWRGGFGAAYGGRVSSVIDISSTQKIPRRIEAGIGLNFTHGHVFTKIPIWKDKSALILSYRRSFTDFWISPTYSKLKERVFQGTKIDENGNDEEDDDALELFDVFSFYDTNVKWILKPTKNDDIQVSFFGGGNNLNYEVINSFEDHMVSDELKLKNWGISAAWTKKWNGKYHSNINTSYSDYEYNYKYLIREEGFSEATENTDKSNLLDDFRIRLENTFMFSERHQLDFGYHFTLQEVAYDISEDFLLEDDFIESRNVKGKTNSLFADYSFKNKKCLLNGGLRYNYYELTGEHYLEPRLSIQYGIIPELKLKANAGIHHQFISQLIELDFNTLGINNEIWILAENEENESVVKSQQINVGFIFKKKGWQIDVEGYLKRLDNITSLSTSFGAQASDNLSEGKSDIIGIDILLKKRWKRYRSWLSYTLAKANYTFPELSNNSFPAFHDQRHTLNWMHLFKWDPIEISLGWTYHSGLPFTPLESTNTEIKTDEEDNEYLVNEPILGSINSSRLEHYHRLDFSMVYSFPHNKNKKWKGKIGFSMKNIYNRSNVFSRTFSDNILEPDDTDRDILEVEKRLLEWTPNVLLRFEWR